MQPDNTEDTKPTNVGASNNDQVEQATENTQKVETRQGDQVDALFNGKSTDSGPTIKINPKKDKVKPFRPGRLLWILLGIILVVVAIGGSAYTGYQNAIQQRVSRQTNQVLFAAGEQYNRALNDIKDQQWAQARTRLEWVIQQDPSFPGAEDQLKVVLIAQARIATPTIAPSPTETNVVILGTATPDLHGVEDYFNQVQTYLGAKDWDKAIATIDLLRQQNKSYRTVDVDGMLFIALRNRGVDNILQKGMLEQGIYDLSLAEAISPLDAEADSYRTWAVAYLAGANYWGVDWQKVVDAFSQIYPALPMLRDGNGYTAQERFRVASVKLADQMAAAGDYCKAQPHYDAALALSKDAAVEAKSQTNQSKCNDSIKAAYTATLISTAPFIINTPSLPIVITVTVPINTPVPTVAATQPPPQATNTLPPPPPTPTPPKPTETTAPPPATTAPPAATTAPPPTTAAPTETPTK